MNTMEMIEAMGERYANPEGFVAVIKATLEAEGIPQAALSRASGYSPTQINRWFRGRGLPALESMMVLDEAMHDLVESWD